LINAPASVTACALLVAALGTANLHAADQRLADAARNQDRRAVEALLQQRADVNGTQGDGATALHWAVHWDDQPTATALIAARANVNAATDQGITALALAASNGSATMVSLLLKAGADPNAASTVGETPLMRAAHSGSAEAVRLLLDGGANVAARENGLQQTALMRAVAENHGDVVRLLAQHSRVVVVEVDHRAVEVGREREPYCPRPAQLQPWIVADADHVHGAAAVDLDAAEETDVRHPAPATELPVDDLLDREDGLGVLMRTVVRR